MAERASRLTLTRASAAHAGVRTRAQRVALFFSRVWAWAFLGLMVLFFVIAVPLTTGIGQFPHHPQFRTFWSRSFRCCS